MASSTPSTPLKNRQATTPVKKQEPKDVDSITPVKRRSRSCFVCGSKKGQLSYISTNAGEAKKIELLISTYIAPPENGGSVCDSCLAKLQTIDKKLAHIQALHKKKSDSEEDATKRCAKESPEKTRTSKQRYMGVTPTKCTPTKSPHKSSQQSPRLSTPKRLDLQSPQSKTQCTPESSSAVRSSAKKLNFQGSEASGPCTPESDSVRSSAKKLDFQSSVSNPYATPESSVTKPTGKRLVFKTPPPVPIRPKGKPPVRKTEPETPSLSDHGYSKGSLLSAIPPHVAQMVSVMHSTPKNIRAAVILPTDLAMIGIGVRTGDAMSKLQSYRKGSPVSLLDRMSTFSWKDVATELLDKFPLLFRVIVSAMLNEADRVSTDRIADIIPRIGMVYALIAETRYNSLSLVQRMISTILLDSGAPVQLYDRLSRPGLCLGYSRSKDLLDMYSGEFDAKVIKGIKAKKALRLVGDNINFYIGVRHERSNKHGKMQHYFGSAFLLRELSFPDLPDFTPQMLGYQIANHQLIPNAAETAGLLDDYAYMAMKVASEKMPFFAYLKKELPPYLADNNSEKLKTKTIVIPLAVIPRNEQYYGDVVEILRSYVQVLRATYRKAGVDVVPRIHVGGDQLTRERFSGAKRLLIGERNQPEGFDILTPVSPEFFHMGMNFLQVAFKRLWAKAGTGEVGTMRGCQSKLGLKTVKPSVKDAYHADRDFAVSFVDAHICELARTYFNMDTIESDPANAPENPTYEWAKEGFKDMIRNNVGTFFYRNDGLNMEPPQAQPQGQPARLYRVVYPNGRVLLVNVQRRPPQPRRDPRYTDHVFQYASLMLELGLVFKNFIECVKVPNRDRMIRTLKLMMVLLKAHNSMSKYADEILRIILYQQAFLSEQQAHIMFYSLFVNTKGRIDSHIACDLQMEYIVRTCKKHLKILGSNKNSKNIARRTGALAGLSQVVHHYDQESNVVSRSGHENSPSKDADERSMIDDLFALKPFWLQANRAHPCFQHVRASLLAHLDYQWFLQWLTRRTQVHDQNLGN